MKQLMVARTFPTYHPRAGEPTNFVEKISSSLGIDCWLDHPYHSLNDFDGACDEMDIYIFQEKLGVPWNFYPKHQTIRQGKRWKTGDQVHLKVWSGKPYGSKTITITPPITLTVYDIEMEGYFIWINQRRYSDCFLGAEKLAKNDGLSVDDFWNWFKYKPTRFQGQILVWGDIKY